MKRFMRFLALAACMFAIYGIYLHATTKNWPMTGLMVILLALNLDTVIKNSR